MAAELIRSLSPKLCCRLFIEISRPEGLGYVSKPVIIPNLPWQDKRKTYLTSTTANEPPLAAFVAFALDPQLVKDFVSASIGGVIMMTQGMTLGDSKAKFAHGGRRPLQESSRNGAKYLDTDGCFC